MSDPFAPRHPHPAEPAHRPAFDLWPEERPGPDDGPGGNAGPDDPDEPSSLGLTAGDVSWALLAGLTVSFILWAVLY
jgi:hypothetical protein